ncbi:twin-arginine translocase TatA/TatE family subunit [Thermomicrobium sp. 4228-Ro]|uniref:twin-arginine translocase TatA/TatE family subunit n=1 Tax=Thermomicrobium sp. 4228-Ro TaxID=2993937 RepID=UPI0022491A41|nr:twin-arginine translocase TatA/TatE family subunit [Thermomicrobium sp. 4228-Ro]MCX2726602.1 twin-arginine translocase TatA/TatE family subunit [Thermomicrobium sp. 4228-Ro]
MPNLGWQELLIILFIVVIIFGASKLPEIGRGLGQSIREFRQAAREAQETQQAEQAQTNLPDKTA